MNSGTPMVTVPDPVPAKAFPYHSIDSSSDSLGAHGSHRHVLVAAADGNLLMSDDSRWPLTTTQGYDPQRARKPNMIH